jgi:hypothetical protein
LFVCLFGALRGICQLSSGCHHCKFRPMLIFHCIELPLLSINCWLCDVNNLFPK